MQAVTITLVFWYAKSESGGRHIVYSTQASGYLSDIVFEEWNGARLAWRLRTEIGSSQGASICRAAIPNLAGDPTIMDGLTTVVVERIDENDDGLSEYLVFAALGQELWYAGGANVEWVDRELAGSDDRIILPNVYRFERCQTRFKQAN